jgi:hypothetical protein
MYVSKKEYMARFQEDVSQSNRNTEELNAYLEKQINRLAQLTADVLPENLWQTIPEVLGIDARLSLIAELIRYEDFSLEDILRIVEEDYRTYYKELCGYDLKTETPPSIIFNVV